MSEGLFYEPGRELDTGPVDEVEASIADLAMPVAISPDRMTPADLPAAPDEIEALRTGSC